MKKKEKKICAKKYLVRCSSLKNISGFRDFFFSLSSLTFLAEKKRSLFSLFFVFALFFCKIALENTIFVFGAMEDQWSSIVSRIPTEARASYSPGLGVVSYAAYPCTNPHAGSDLTGAPSTRWL